MSDRLLHGASSVPLGVGSAADQQFGLTGLSIAAREEPGWPNALSEADAEVATRFALYELNGFPSWLPSLYAVYPQTVSIVQGSLLDDASIARLAAEQAKATANLATAPMWFAMWVGVDPAIAIPALASRLAEMKEDGDSSEFAMHFITALIGGRHGGRGAQQGYRTVEHMKALYLLIHEHVRQADDIERAGRGVYPPGLRDNAQDARNALFSFIRETPGKEAFLALMDISRAHPAESSRPWMAFHAKTKAALDADAKAWSPRQVREFHEELERTPGSGRSSGAQTPARQPRASPRSTSRYRPVPALPEMMSLTGDHSTPLPAGCAMAARRSTTRPAPSRSRTSPVAFHVSASAKPIPASPVYKPASRSDATRESSQSAPAVAVARSAASPVAWCSSRKNNTTPVEPE